MKVTMLSEVIIRIQANKAAVSMTTKGCIGASEVFIIFNTQLYSCLCNYNALFFITSY